MNVNVISNDQAKCDEALAGLHEVIDPEIGLNVVDLGLIYQIDFDDTSRKIYCSMTLTTQFCPMGESISTGVENSISNTFPDYMVEVKIVFEPHWDSSKISDTGRDFLNS